MQDAEAKPTHIGGDGLLNFMGTVACAIILSFAIAFTVQRFWLWYVAGPLGWRILSMPQAYGLYLFIKLFSAQESKASWREVLSGSAVRLVVAWLFAALLHMFW